MVTLNPQSCPPSTNLQAYPCQMHHHVLQNVMKNLGCICNHSIANFSTPFQNKQKQTWLTFHQIPAILLLLCTLHQPYNHTCILLYAEMRKTQNITGYLNFQTVWNTYLNTTHLMSLSLSPTPFNHSSAIKIDIIEGSSLLCRKLDLISQLIWHTIMNPFVMVTWIKQ